MVILHIGAVREMAIRRMSDDKVRLDMDDSFVERLATMAQYTTDERRHAAFDNWRQGQSASDFPATIDDRQTIGNHYYNDCRNIIKFHYDFA